MIPVTLAVLLLVPAASAENKPYSLRNGRASAPRAAAPVAAAPPQALPAPSSPQALAQHQLHAQNGPRTYALSNGAARRQTGRGLGFRRADEEQPPAHFSKPGALIRSEGQLPQYAKPDESPRRHEVHAGEVQLDPRYAQHSGRAPGVRQGPRDTPPPPNPGGSSSAGGATTNLGSRGGGTGVPEGEGGGKGDDGWGDGHGGGRDKNLSSTTGFAGF